MLPSEIPKLPTDPPVRVFPGVWKLLFFFFFFLFIFFKFYFIFKLYIIVLVLPNIKMNLPQVYMCSPSWTLLPPPSPYHPSGSPQCTSPRHPVSCIEPGLATRFIYDILHVSMPFSQIFPPSPSPTKSIRLFYTSVSLLTITLCTRQQKRHWCIEQSFGLCGRGPRVGWFGRMALKYI